MKYLHELSRRNVTVGVVVLVLLVLARPAFEHQQATLSTQATPTDIMGIDVSHYQGDIDWSKVKGDAVRFVFVKATEGVSYVDPFSKKNAASLRSNGIPFGNYHFFHPNEDSERQARFFLKHLSKPLLLPPVLDIEIVQSVSAEELRDKAKTWLALVEKETGCTPIIYTDLSFWQSFFSESFEQYPLWLAEYRPHLYIPTEMKRWSIWQKSESGTISGISGNVDINQLNHSHVSLENLQC
ncbi:MAG: glycoside hydrolase family 25 protein [Aestuariibacter sp.]